MEDYYSNSLLSGGNISTPTVLKGKNLPRGELIVITPKGILFISQKDLVKYLQIPVHASNPKMLPFLTPKVHPRVCWFI